MDLLRLPYCRIVIKRQPYICYRCLHNTGKRQPPSVPPPTPFVPDQSTFLSLIGRGLSKHAPKFQTWEDLFTTSSDNMGHMGITPAKTRRYLLRWCDKFRRGDYGIGGDLQHVENGIAELRVLEVPRLKEPSKEEGGEEEEYASAATTPGMRKLVVNLPRGATTYNGSPAELKKPSGFTLHRGREVAGPYIEWSPGTSKTVALFKSREGMWEDRLGQKVDGGERRKAEVRAKRRLEERRKASG